MGRKEHRGRQARGVFLRGRAADPPPGAGHFRTGTPIDGLNLQAITPFAIELHDIIITKLGRYHAKDQAGVQLPLYFIHLAVIHRRRPERVFQGWLLLAGRALLVIGSCVGIMHIAGDRQDAWFWFRFNFAYIREGLDLSEVAGRAVGPCLHPRQPDAP